MPKSELTLQLDNFKAMRVMQLMSSGKKKGDACKVIGIDPKTFDAILERTPGLLDEFILTEKNEIQQLFSQISQTRKQLILNLLDKAANPELPLNAALALEERFRNLMGEIAQELSLVPNTSITRTSIANAEDFLSRLSGPKLHKGKNIVTVKQTETTLSLELDKNEDEIIILDND